MKRLASLFLSVPAICFGYFLMALGVTFSALGLLIFESGSFILGGETVAAILGEDEEK